MIQFYGHRQVLIENMLKINYGSVPKLCDAIAAFASMSPLIAFSAIDTNFLLLKI